MRVKWYCWGGLALYAVLSATDLLLTFALLQTNTAAYESNPLAAACLDRYGWHGLTLYKVGAVLVVVGAVALLVRRKPVLGAAVVTFGCLVLLSVTSYSHDLLQQAPERTIRPSDVPRRTLPSPVAEGRRITERGLVNVE